MFCTPLNDKKRETINGKGIYFWIVFCLQTIIAMAKEEAYLFNIKHRRTGYDLDCCLRGNDNHFCYCYNAAIQKLQE
jgi:hypothetical protein